MREETVEASVREWYGFLSAYHAAVLGWVSGTEKIDGQFPTREAVDDRLKLVRHAMDTIFGGREQFNTCWTYITRAREPVSFFDGGRTSGAAVP